MALIIKGIGNAASRANEITPDFDAHLLGWLTSYDKAILKGHLGELAVTRSGTAISVAAGLFFVYGYACYNSAITTLTQQYGTGTSYSYVYLNADLSGATGKFEVKLTTPSTSDAVTWTQNNLYTNPVGRYQQPLAKLTITSSSITVTDMRADLLKPYPQKVKTAEDYISGGAIEAALNLKAPLLSPALTGTPTAPTAAQSVNNTQIATTAYIRTAIANVRSDILDNLKNTPLLNAPWSYDITTSTGSTRINLAHAINFSTDFIYLSTTNKLNGDEKYIVKKYLPINGGVLCSFDTAGGLTTSIYIRLKIVSSTAIDLEWQNLYSSAMTGWNYRGVFELQYIGASHWER